MPDLLLTLGRIGGFDRCNMIDLLERRRIVREESPVWIICEIVTSMYFRLFKNILGNMELIGGCARC